MPDSSSTQADFVCRGLLGDADRAIRGLLAPKRQNVGDAVVERIYEARGWVVRGAPAISVSLFSRLTYRHDLKSYAARENNPEKLRGLFVADKTSSLKGEITEIAGRLANSRAWLLGITQREEMQALIALQGWIVAPDAIDAFDQVVEVARSIPIPVANLVFL